MGRYHIRYGHFLCRDTWYSMSAEKYCFFLFVWSVIWSSGDMGHVKVCVEDDDAGINTWSAALFYKFQEKGYKYP